MITAIIPTWNEASTIDEAVNSLRRQGIEEIVVVDGGSTDSTLDAAFAADVRLSGPPGRAIQMNAGAASARGEILLFLHADCLLENGAVSSMRRLLNHEGVAAGCFTMRVRQNGWGFRCIDGCATARVRFTGIAYGDQGLFLKRQTFQSIGGFPPLRFMEDVFISRRLRRIGKMAVSPSRIWVSPRRWLKTGLLRQTLSNWRLTALALAGIHPNLLAEAYRRDVR